MSGDYQQLLLAVLFFGDCFGLVDLFFEEFFLLLYLEGRFELLLPHARDRLRDAVFVLLLRVDDCGAQLVFGLFLFASGFEQLGPVFLGEFFGALAGLVVGRLAADGREVEGVLFVFLGLSQSLVRAVFFLLFLFFVGDEDFVELLDLFDG